MSEVAAGGDASGRRLAKSPDAFRTISEVAADLNVPQHVLRFWETKFSQIKPLKRGGGRRYYRPEDVDLLRRIRTLLYSEGYTIKGVQKVLREHVAPTPPAAAVHPGREGQARPAHVTEPLPVLGRLTSGDASRAAPSVAGDRALLERLLRDLLALQADLQTLQK